VWRLRTSSGACRIIGCGNTDRGDDAAGVLVARRLRELGADALEHSGEGLSLIESWQGWGSVILIDAVATGAPAGAITVWDGNRTPLTGDCRKGNTHNFGVAEAVELARVLGQLPQRLLIYGIEGQRFDLGCAPSSEVTRAVERLAQQLAEVCLPALPE
jgi:hydrogenase maturation protease